MTGSVVLDIALVLLLLAYGYSGYRQGLIQSVFSLVGFFAFAMFAVWQLPEMLARWQSVADNDRTRVLVLILGVVAFGWLGQYAASLIIWFIGGALRTAGNPALSKAMADSKVLQVVNSVVPEQTGQVFASFRGFLSSQGFPQVFGDLAPEPITPVP